MYGWLVVLVALVGAVSVVCGWLVVLVALVGAVWMACCAGSPGWCCERGAAVYR